MKKKPKTCLYRGVKLRFIRLQSTAYCQKKTRGFSNQGHLSWRSLLPTTWDGSILLGNTSIFRHNLNTTHLPLRVVLKIKSCSENVCKAFNTMAGNKDCSATENHQHGSARNTQLWGAADGSSHPQHSPPTHTQRYSCKEKVKQILMYIGNRKQNRFKLDKDIHVRNNFLNTKLSNNCRSFIAKNNLRDETAIFSNLVV